MEPWIFDVIVVAVIAISAIMSLGRGLIREAFSVVSFLIGAMVATAAVIYLKKPLQDLIGADDDLIPIAILTVIGFLGAYMAAAFVGGRLSKLIHSSPEIGALDRLAGAAFGIARGFIAMLLFVLLVRELFPENNPPEFIDKAWSYKTVLGPSSEWIRETVPGFVNDATKGLNIGADPSAPREDPQ